MYLRKLIFVLIIFAVMISVFIFDPRLMPDLNDYQVSEERDADRYIVSWQENFTKMSGLRGKLPTGWVVQGKLGTKPAEFYINNDDSGNAYLFMEADKASSSLITRVDGVDLKATPILRWSWMAYELPDNADGRFKSRDDQAIGIYVGTGSTLNNKSVSYRWDTDTPVGKTGNVSYGMGAVKVRWFTLRNKEDAFNEKWYVEERDVAQDFYDAWGFYPEEVYVSVSCNSQYTKSRAAAALGWIEFASPAEGGV